MNITQLFETYKTDVFRFALSITRDSYLSQDITQDVFLSLIQNISRIDDITKIKSWLLTTAKNMALNMLHKRSLETGEIIDEIDIPLSAVEKDSYQVEFLTMLDCLDETDRQIVVLHIVNGLKHKEIAHIIDMQPGTVRQRYTRSLKLIKQNL